MHPPRAPCALWRSSAATPRPSGPPNALAGAPLWPPHPFVDAGRRAPHRAGHALRIPAAFRRPRTGGVTILHVVHASSGRRGRRAHAWSLPRHAPGLLAAAAANRAQHLARRIANAHACSCTPSYRECSSAVHLATQPFVCSLHLCVCWHDQGWADAAQAGASQCLTLHSSWPSSQVSGVTAELPPS
jgi:hypothetical protein